MRSRINKLGVSEPEIRKQGSDQIVIELPGVQDQQRAAELIGQTAKLELYDLQGDLVPGVSLDLEGFPGRARRRSSSSSRRSSRGEEGDAAAFYLVDTNKKARRSRPVVVGPSQTREKLLIVEVRHEGHGKKGEVPKGTTVLAVPENMVVITCGKTRAVLPGRDNAPDRHLLLPLQVRPDEQGEPDPGDDGLRPEAHGHAAGLRPADRASRSCSCSSRASGGEEVPATSRSARRARQVAGTAGAGGRPQTTPAVRDRPRPRDQVGAVDRLQRQYPNGIPGNNGAQITGIGSTRARRRTSRSSSRPARCPSTSSRSSSTDISATLGKDSLQQAKNGGDRRPDRRRALPAPLLPLPRPRRGHRPRASTRRSSTRRSCSSTSR